VHGASPSRQRSFLRFGFAKLVDSDDEMKGGTPSAVAMVDLLSLSMRKHVIILH
jgi:hypothetical protein